MKSAGSVLKAFLHAKMKTEQLKLRIRNYVSRIDCIRTRSRATTAKMRVYEESLIDGMDAAIVSIKSLTFSREGKKLQQSKRGATLVSQLKGIPSIQPEQRLDIRKDRDDKKGVGHFEEDPWTKILMEVARDHMQLSKYVHLINLIRWYGLFRNDGRYNLTCLMTVFEKVDAYLANKETIHSKVKEWYPSVESLKKIKLKINKKKSEGGGSPLKVDMNGDIGLSVYEEQDLFEWDEQHRLEIQ